MPAIAVHSRFKVCEKIPLHLSVLIYRIYFNYLPLQMAVMNSLKTSELEPIIKQLNEASAHYRCWMQNLMRTLVCRLEHDPIETRADAHCHCEFGKWYYAAHPDALLQSPAFLEIAERHEKMHAYAASMLQINGSDRVVTTHDFDCFRDNHEAFFLAVEALKAEIEGYMLNRDSLTGVLNRTLLHTELERLRQIVTRRVSSASLVMVDLDHFKRLNDTHGHPFGDKVLHGVAEFFTGSLRPFDKVFRYGGEEFLIAMIDTDAESAFSIAERLREGLADIAFETEHGDEVFITASFGVAQMRPEYASEECVENADKALYRAKESGRNRVEIYWPAQPEA